MRSRRRLRPVLWIVLVTLSIAEPARAQMSEDEPELDVAPLSPGDRVEFNLEDGTLEDLVRIVTRITGRAFMVTGTLREVRASVSSTRPVTAAEAYRAFLAILHQNGLTVVRRGRYYQIVESEHIDAMPTPVVRDGEAIPIDERFITWIHRTEHVPAADAAQVLEPLRSPDGGLVTYAPTDTLIVIDTGANIRRMREILVEIDVGGDGTHVWVEPIHFGDATTIAEMLTTIFADGSTPAPEARQQRQAGERTPPAQGAQNVGARREIVLHRVIPEPRTNALIIVATEAGYRQVIAILREIDREGGAEVTARVHRLQHGDAENIATTLEALLGDSAAGTGGAERPPAIAGLRGRVRVEAHADLNALVITATGADYRTIAPLIEDLDAAPRQVFLEMVVLELSVDHGNDVGVNLLSGLAGMLGPGSVGLISGGGGAGLAEDLLHGITLGLSGPNVRDSRLPNGSAPSFGVLLHAISSSNQANILSTPSIMVLDNREAVINVGQNVPLQGSNVPSLPGLLPTITGEADASALSAAINPSAGGGRRDTGTIVHVTPHINDDGEVRLEMQVEDSRTGDVAEGNLNAVALHQSIAETELVVGDGQTVVIGGLVREDERTTRSGVPFLSEIPVLGPLFGQSGRRVERRNLVFLVTPYIVRSPTDIRAIYERRARERREFMDRHMVFDGDWEPPIDYSRTRGLVSEMMDTIAAIDAEAEQAAADARERANVGHEVREAIDMTAH